MGCLGLRPVQPSLGVRWEEVFQQKGVVGVGKEAGGVEGEESRGRVGTGESCLPLAQDRSRQRCLPSCPSAIK